MKRQTMIAASIAVTASLLGIPGVAKAQPYSITCGYPFVPSYYASADGVQSPWTCIYPAPNWSYFFHRAHHYGPIVLRQRAPDLRYRWFQY